MLEGHQATNLMSSVCRQDTCIKNSAVVHYHKSPKSKDKTLKTAVETPKAVARVHEDTPQGEGSAEGRRTPHRGFSPVRNMHLRWLLANAGSCEARRLGDPK